jgi:hypothetical protein
MIHRQSLRVVLTDLAASAALLALDLAGRIADRRKPAPEPVVEPVVESLPRQRGILLPVAAIPEAELHAMARVLVGEADDQDRALVSDYCRFVGLMQEVEK